MLQLFTRRPGVLGAALLLGGLVMAAPEVSWAGERCKTKPAVCARLKAQRAQQGAPAETFAARPAVPARALAQYSDASCTLKPGVCARLRNEAAARGYQPAPVQVASYYTGTSSRCTSKPAVCARLENGPSRRPVTLANEPGPSAVD